MIKGHVVLVAPAFQKSSKTARTWGRFARPDSRQLQGDPRLAGIKRVGRNEPSGDEIDFPAWVGIGSAQRFARPRSARKNNRNAFG